MQSDQAGQTSRRRPPTLPAARHSLSFLTCPYCSQTFGSWGREPIEPCPTCRRPLHRSLGWRRPRRVALLLGTINAMQGIGMMMAMSLFIIGAISLHQLCGGVALALFVAGTAYIVDGALAWQTRMSRTFGQLVTGTHARVGGVLTMLFGLAAMLLSLAGLIYLIGGSR